MTIIKKNQFQWSFCRRRLTIKVEGSSVRCSKSYDEAVLLGSSSNENSDTINKIWFFTAENPLGGTNLAVEE